MGKKVYIHSICCFVILMIIFYKQIFFRFAYIAYCDSYIYVSVPQPTVTFLYFSQNHIT